MKNLNIGDYFTRREIHEIFGGEIQSSLPQNKGRIVCGCFSRQFNPDAPDEVQVGRFTKVMKKAKILSTQKQAIPVFIKDNGNGAGQDRIWCYCGKYRFHDLQDDQKQIQEAEQKSQRHGEVALLLKLRKV